MNNNNSNNNAKQANVDVILLRIPGNVILLGTLIGFLVTLLMLVGLVITDNVSTPERLVTTTTPCKENANSNNNSSCGNDATNPLVLLTFLELHSIYPFLFVSMPILYVAIFLLPWWWSPWYQSAMLSNRREPENSNDATTIIRVKSDDGGCTSRGSKRELDEEAPHHHHHHDASSNNGFMLLNDDDGMFKQQQEEEPEQIFLCLKLLLLQSSYLVGLCGLKLLLASVLGVHPTHDYMFHLGVHLVVTMAIAACSIIYYRYFLSDIGIAHCPLLGTIVAKKKKEKVEH